MADENLENLEETQENDSEDNSYTDADKALGNDLATEEIQEGGLPGTIDEETGDAIVHGEDAIVGIKFENPG